LVLLFFLVKQQLCPLLFCLFLSYTKCIVMNSSEFCVETYVTISRKENFLVSSPNEYSGVTVLSISDEKSCTFTVVPIQDKV